MFLFYEELEELCKKGEWDELCETILAYDYLYHEHDTYFLEKCFSLYYKALPNNKKYDFAIEAYIYNKGYKIPMIRNAIMHLRKYGKPKLPSRIASKKIITVYRFGLENIDEAKYGISWTLSQKVAMWFMERYVHLNIGIREYGIGGLRTTFTYKNDGLLHLYQGKIENEKIIAYTNSREEFEIMQNKSVYDIIDISPKVIILKPLE